MLSDLFNVIYSVYVLVVKEVRNRQMLHIRRFDVEMSDVNV